MMSRDGHGSGRKTVKKWGGAEKTPQISDIHFPVGGPRLRPALEDFLTMLIEELGVDHPPHARQELDQARARWRTEQAKAIVRSSSGIAADVLREMGWAVSPPEGYSWRASVRSGGGSIECIARGPGKALSSSPGSPLREPPYCTRVGGH